MTSRLAAAIASAVVLAAGIAIVSGQRNVQAQPSAPRDSAATVPSPPGVNPARWFPLGPTSGVALHPESQATSPDTVLSGDLWVIVNGQWHVVQLPAAPQSSPSTVPAVSVIPLSALPPAA
jgi:hypothetical protein